MNIQTSLQNPDTLSPGFDKKVGNTRISALDRKRILIFVTIALGLYVAAYLVVFLGGERFSNFRNAASSQANLLRSALMFTPLIAHIATRLITREGWSNTFLGVNFRSGRWRYYLAAWFLPTVAVMVGGVIYYLLFPGKFDPSMTDARELGLVGSAVEPWKAFITRLGIAILSPLPPMNIGLFLACFGEEFGWRAYLLPKLMPLGPRKAVLLVAAIWGVWHWPAILTGFNYGLDYWGAPLVGPLMFVLTLIFPSAFYAWVTLRSGSVWPAVLVHSADNASNSLMLFFLRGEANLLIGPGVQGIVGSLGYALLALLIFSSPRALAQPAPALAGAALSTSPAAVEKVADQAKLGINS
ncbi:MAG TPA: CPBP family intramembrane glutamic endopeptidase [Anaerolineales bacterium]|nr:CPBP family intramembrane glutamic endopeptidase [Anaerolineales bacterium]